MNRRPPRTPAAKTTAGLTAWQRIIALAVMRPLSPEGRLRPEWADGRTVEEFAASMIKAGGGLKPHERLEIYNRQYWIRVLECLTEDYPGVRAILGGATFQTLATAYLMEHPSTRYTLRDLGRHLPAFIRSNPRWTGLRRLAAFEMAQLEWAYVQAFDGESKPALRTEDLAGTARRPLKLALQPYLTLLSLSHPWDDFLLALKHRAGGRGDASNAAGDSWAPGRAQPAALPRRRPTHLAVHRHKNVVHYKRLSQPQFKVLQALAQGQSLERSLDALRRRDRIIADEVQAWFRDWTSLGWLVRATFAS